MDKATYVDMEQTLCYYDLETIEASLLLLNDKLREELNNASERKKSVERTLKRIQEKIKDKQMYK